MSVDPNEPASAVEPLFDAAAAFLLPVLVMAFLAWGVHRMLNPTGRGRAFRPLSVEHLRRANDEVHRVAVRDDKVKVLRGRDPVPKGAKVLTFSKAPLTHDVQGNSALTADQHAVDYDLTFKLVVTYPYLAAHAGYHPLWEHDFGDQLRTIIDEAIGKVSRITFFDERKQALFDLQAQLNKELEPRGLHLDDLHFSNLQRPKATTLRSSTPQGKLELDAKRALGDLLKPPRAQQADA